ncbi:hypothetical protein LTR53_014013 [Teratosphaeriaceae sp. CCFEE 6253]|nr:hypothetical protein LTR53_014013 [Teratosphaeriaceae sp. CCFEE 6253]
MEPSDGDYRAAWPGRLAGMSADAASLAADERDDMNDDEKATLAARVGVMISRVDRVVKELRGHVQTQQDACDAKWNSAVEKIAGAEAVEKAIMQRETAFAESLGALRLSEKDYEQRVESLKRREADVDELKGKVQREHEKGRLELDAESVLNKMELQLEYGLKALASKELQAATRDADREKLAQTDAERWLDHERRVRELEEHSAARLQEELQALERTFADEQLTSREQIVTKGEEANAAFEEAYRTRSAAVSEAERIRSAAVEELWSMRSMAVSGAEKVRSAAAEELESMRR